MRIPSSPACRRGAATALAAALALLALGGCQAFSSADRILGVITPYRIEVVQGNVLTREQAALVRPGMSRAQVRDVLGSPLLTDPFHADRWDYVFTIRRPGTKPQSRAVVVLFEGDALKTIETEGELPGEREFVASIDTRPTPGKVPSLALTEEQRRALPLPKRQPPAEDVPEGPLRTYPPLESPGS